MPTLDFTRIKEIPIADVCARYKVALRYRGEWGSAMCPLPTHKQGEREKTFSISTAKNYFKCFSTSCNEQAGCKGGDVINFVALMDGCSQLDAAKKLADWFTIPEIKTASHMGKPSNQKPEMQKATSEPSTSGENLKYMQEVEAWFDATFKQGEQEPDEEYRKRCLKSLKSRLLDSYRAGQRSKAA
jgi:hypothetical protein